jgi:hypothetical protein
MIDKFYNWIIYMKKIDFKGRQIVYKIMKLIINVCYPFIILFHKKKYGINMNGNIIISLTSFPERISTVYITIDTLLCQTMKPQKVILWLASSQFQGKEKLPKRLLEMEERGLEIRFCDDLRSHKKYYYTMLEFPDNIIITVDDDMFYPFALVEKLYNKHLEFPKSVCCNWAHVITFDKNNNIENYLKWSGGVSGYTNPNTLLSPVGAEGILYPPHCLSKCVYDKKSIKKCAPYADDIWLKLMAVLAGTKAVRVDEVAIPYFNIVKAQKFTLQKINIQENKNDAQTKAIISMYPEIEDYFEKEIINGKNFG